MSNFRSEDSGKFLGGVILYGFDNQERTKLTATVEIPGHRRPALLDMDQAVACEITENGDFVDTPVTLNPDYIYKMAFVKGDGSITVNATWDVPRDQKLALQYLANRIMEALGEVPTEAEKEAFRIREIGTHVSHCCERHGCKYGDGEDCAVQSKRHKQDYPCESCVDIAEAEADIKNLLEEIAFRKSLSA